MGNVLHMHEQRIVSTIWVYIKGFARSDNMGLYPSELCPSERNVRPKIAFV